jgi:hypothetical protein
MRSDIVPGGAFPDYELPDHTGTQRKLSELQDDDPLILTLVRLFSWLLGDSSRLSLGRVMVSVEVLQVLSCDRSDAGSPNCRSDTILCLENSQGKQGKRELA